MDAQLMASIGGYRVERELGAGGMGLVYLCRDDALDRLVAIKVLQPELCEQSEMRARFLREARALARVSSPHVVAVHAVGEDPVVGPFVVMEYLEGEDLLQRITREGRVPWRDAVRITRDAVQGLIAAEAAGIVHRDIKPANLFDVNGKAKLTDFGLARQIEGGANVTQAGLVVGTPAYLAPEVVKGAPASHQSDLYSLGATLFHLLSGRPPFTAESPLEVVAQAIREDPPAVTALAPETPPALGALVARMLKKTAADRPQGWVALDEELASSLGAADAAPAPAGRTAIFGALPAPATGGPAAPAPGPAPGPDRSLASIVSSGVLEVAAAPSPPQEPALGTLPTMQMQLASPGPTSGVNDPSGAGHVLGDGGLSTGEQPALRIKTAALTVMMTDIAGYTERTSRVSREESARWLALHDALLQPVFRAFEGKVVKTLGDAFLVTFPSPTDAVLCACAVQDRLWLYNRGHTHGAVKPEDAIHVRVALSAGEVRLHKGDIFGEPVNLAARLEGIGKPGEVLLTDAVFATMNTSEVKLAERGEQQFKGISRPVTVYAAVPDEVPAGTEGSQPPFGGRALARVKSGVVDELVSQAPQAIARAQAAAAPLLGSIGRLASKRAFAAAGGVALIVIAFALLPGLGDRRLSRIDAGDAKAVAAEIEKIPPAERSGKDLLLLGHARHALENRKQAFSHYLSAAKKDVVDNRAKSAALSALEKKDADGAVDLLAAWPSSSIERELRDLLEGDSWWPRHHALAILDQRKALTDEQRMAVALKDVTADSCGDRRHGAMALKRVGKGEEALAAIKKLRADALGNACMMFDLASVEDAIKKRTEE
jgi:serine/threonine protein kinase, bacterial